MRPKGILSKSEVKYLLIILALSFGISSTTLYILGMSWFIPQFLALALGDSINPCTFVVYTLFLIALSVKGLNRKQLYIIGSSFIVAVYVSYYTLGLGLSFVARRIPLRWAAYFALAFGAYTIVTGVMERSRVARKEVARKKAFSEEATIVGGLLLGFTISTTLLPCSAGPYLVYAAVISRSSAQMVFLMLALYNIVFVLPLTVILLVMGSLRESKEFSRAMVCHSAELSVIAGVLLIGMGVWLLRVG